MATSVKDGNYSDASIWDTGSVPTINDDVVIAHHVTVDTASCEAKSVTINVGGWLDVTAGNKLTVAGNIIGNAGSSWTSLGAKLTMTSDDTNGSAEIAITSSGAYIYMQSYCQVEIQGTSSNWCKIYGSGVDMAYLRVYRCKGEIDYLKIFKASSVYSPFRVYAIYEGDYGGYPMHLKNIWVDDYGNRTFYSNTVYLHSDSYLKYTNMRDINTSYPGGTTNKVYGYGTIYIDYSGYTQTTYASYLFGDTRLYDNVTMIIKSANDISNRLFNYAFTSGGVIQDNAVVDVETYYTLYAYFYDSASLYYRYKGTGNVIIYASWFSNGTLYVDCNNTTGYCKLFLGNYQWKQVEGFRIEIVNYGGSQLEIQPSGLRINNMNMTAESKIIADSILTIPAPCNQYEPLIFCTDENNKYGQIYWEFEYPYNKDNTDYFVLNNASWDLTNGRININANGSVNLYVQPVSFVAGRSGVSITKSGTLSIQYAISQDGGQSWSSWKDLNDTNWGAESGYMGFGNEVIAIKIEETGGSSAYIDTIRLPFEYRDLYTSQLTEEQMLTQILGLINNDVLKGLALLKTLNLAKF